MTKESPKFYFPKIEKLTQHLLIEELFSANHPSLMVFPIKMVYFFDTHTNLPMLPKVLVLVSKRNVNKSVNRNYVKRRIREAYRLNKHILLAKLNPTIPHNLVLMFIYTQRDIAPFTQIQQSIQKIFSKIEFN